MPKKHICDRCKKGFDTKFNLERHLNKKNPCTSEKIENVCNICEKVFKSKTGLDYHKNKKKPCKPIVEKLKEENAQLKSLIVTNNNIINNNTTNNNQKINTKNIQYNIYVNSNDLSNIKDNLNSFSYKQIDKIIKHIDIENNEQIQLLNINKNYCKDFILDNTDEICDLFKILYANFKYLPCILFRLDELNFDEIYVKDDINTLNKLDNSKLLYIIYETFNVLIKEYSEFINQKLKKYYKDFITQYNNGLFKDLNKDHVKKFLSDIKNKLRNHIIELYDDLELLYKKNIKKLNNKNNDFTNYLKLKNKETIENNIIVPNKKIKKNDLDNINSILNRLLNDNKIKLHNYIIIKSEDFNILALFEFFLHNYYFINGNHANIKIENNKLYEYIGNSWEKISIEDFSEKIINDINDELIVRNICYDKKNNKFIIDKDNIYNFYDVIENSYIGNIVDNIIKYLFKFKKIENYFETFTKEILIYQ